MDFPVAAFAWVVPLATQRWFDRLLPRRPTGGFGSDSDRWLFPDAFPRTLDHSPSLQPGEEDEMSRHRGRRRSRDRRANRSL